jgi:excisionase family DNA binding protein
MDVPVFIEIDSDDGVGPLIEFARFVNEKCSEISQRAWEHRALDRPQIEELVGDDLHYRDGLHPSLVQTLIDRVADAFVRNRAKYAPTFDPRTSLLLKEDSGVITFDPQRASRQVEIWTLERKFVYQASLGDLYPPQNALLEYRTGEYGLIVDFEDDRTEAEYCTCLLGVVCRVSNVAARAFKMVEWLPQVLAPQSLGQPVEIPDALEDIIPPDHPLRDTVSPLELRDSPFFSVKDLSMVMGIPVGRIYPMIDRKEIAGERCGSAVRVPRAEFSRLAALYLYQQAGAKREVLAAAQEIEKAARRLRQAVEPAL